MSKSHQKISIERVEKVDDWYRAEEYSTGSREKRILIRPDDEKHFIFKFPKERREHQIWSELLASYIAGDLLGWEVQRTFIGVQDGRIGNLLEYIYEPGSKTKRQENFIEGWTYCKQLDPTFDMKKGTDHSWPLLLRVCDEILVESTSLTRVDFLEFWAQAFALDCLISNTDRHAENWGVISVAGNTKMAPLYDNGSSLGCGTESVGLARIFDENGSIKREHRKKILLKGRHHVRPNGPGKRGGTFEEVSQVFLAGYPDGITAFKKALSVDIDDVRGLMVTISRDLDVPDDYRLCKLRIEHICATLDAGQERLKNIIRNQ